MTKFLRSRFYRLHEMVKLIRRGMDTGHLANSTTFTHAFSVTRQTVANDLSILKDDWSAPIVYNSSRKGYYLSDPHWCVPSLRLERREIFALGVARKLIGAFRGTPLEDEINSVLAKISANLDGAVSFDPVLLNEHMTVIGDDYVPQSVNVWLRIAHAIDKREQLAVEYIKFNGDRKNYILDPWHMAAYHGEWYIICYHHKRGAMATFSLSRVQKIEATGTFFAPPDTELIKQRLKDGLGIAQSGQVMKVHLRCSKSIAHYISNRQWHPSQEVVCNADQTIDLIIHTSGWKELVRFVLSWQPDMIVIAPTKLRERVVEKMNSGLKAQNLSG